MSKGIGCSARVIMQDENTVLYSPHALRGTLSTVFPPRSNTQLPNLVPRTRI